MPAFDPKKTLKKISNRILKQFFASRDELLDVPWDDLSEHKIEPIYEAWQELGSKERSEVLRILQDVESLSNERGLTVLFEELKRVDPRLIDEVETLKSKQEIALWIHMHASQAFKKAIIFAHADSLTSGRYWYRRKGLPKRKIAFDFERLEKIETELVAYYRSAQMRGQRCKVEYESRQDGSDYLFAYLEDHPDRSLGFEEDGDELTVRSGRAAFENMFVLNTSEGTLEMFVKGGKKVVDPLLTHICRGIWDKDVATKVQHKPSYNLDQFFQIDHPLPTDPAWGVREARITRLRFTQRGTSSYVEVKAGRGSSQNDIYRRLESQIQLSRFPQFGTKVLQATFQLEFDNGHNKQSTMSFDVSVPDSCTLKSKSDSHRVVGEKCLKQWGVISDA